MHKVNGRAVAPPVPLPTEDAVWDYISQQKRLFPEVRVTDGAGRVVAQAVEEAILLPARWRELDRKYCSQL